MSDYSSTDAPSRSHFVQTVFRDVRPSPVYDTRQRRNVRIDSDDEYDASTLYSYTLSRGASRSLSKRGSTTATSGDEGGSDDGAHPEPQTPRGPAPPLAYHVFESRYTGDGKFGGQHAAGLSAVSDTKVKYQPLFRWIHITRTIMDFEHFSAEVSRIDKLSTVERNSLTKLLSRLKRDFLRPVQLPNGSRVHVMKPGFLQETLPAGSQHKEFRSRKLCWTALPYFSLEKYAGLESGTGSGGASPVPAQTLLQTQFAHAAKGRDMRQAVCWDGGNRRKELCLHVAQLWGVVLDDSLLITYSTMTDSALSGDFVTKTIGTLDAFVGVPGKRKIMVKFGKAAMWSIPLDECQTWFAFVSHSHEFWPRRLEVFHQKRKVTAKDWEGIWRRARQVNTKVKIELRLGGRPAPPRRGKLLPDSGRKEKSAETIVHDAPTVRFETAKGGPPESHPAPDTSGKESLPQVVLPEAYVETDSFSVFTCLDGASKSDTELIDSDIIRDHLEEVDDWLRHMTRFTDAKAYKTCGQSSRSSVRLFLEDNGRELEELGVNESWGKQARFEDNIDMFNAADTIFRFFLPVDFEGPTVGQYWGAIQSLMDNTFEARDRRYQPPFRLRGLALNTAPLTELLSHARGADRARATVPNEMTEAWVHLLLALVNLDRAEHAARLFDDATELLSQAASEMVKSLSQKSLEESAVVQPLEILSLISLKLVQRVSNVDSFQQDSIFQIYRNRLEAIAADIDKRPSDRANERNLRLVDEEIQIVQQTLSQQSRIFSALTTLGRNGAAHEAMFLDPVDREPSGPRHPSAPRHEFIHDRGLYNDRYTVETSNPRTSNQRTSNRRTSNSRYYSSDANDGGYRPARYSRETYGRNEYADGDEEQYTSAMRYPLRSGQLYVSDVPIAEEAWSMFKLDPTDPGGYRDLLVQECAAKLAQITDEFHQLSYRCADLKTDSREMADTTKFRQENAVYAFTIVTVIFLPLSAVSSIFGMNTSDIRNLEQGQWLYWATAIPVTLGVILLGLLWTGELRNAFQWVFWSVARWVFLHMAGDRRAGQRLVEEWYRRDDDRSSSRPYSQAPSQRTVLFDTRKSH